MAREFADKVKDGKNGITLSITSSGGNIFHNVPIATTLSATVFYGDSVITNQQMLEQVFGSGAVINWYDKDERLEGSGFTLSVQSSADTEKYKARLEI